MIDKSKQYKTRDGREVRIYATDGGSYTPVMGATSYTSKEGKTWWESARWTEDGAYDAYGRETNSDLIEVRPRIKRTVWLNVYCGFVWGYESKKAADEGSHETRLACVRVEIDVEEGTGL